MSLHFEGFIETEQGEEEYFIVESNSNESDPDNEFQIANFEVSDREDENVPGIIFF